MQFHEVRFPTDLSFGSTGGPERRTEIVTLANGFEERNTPWSQSRRRYDAGVGLRSLDDIDVVIGFFEARRGQMHGFRWKDWSDFKSCRPSEQPGFADQLIGLGDGTVARFGLIKRYQSGAHSYDRAISKPVSGSVRVGVDGAELMEGSDFSVVESTGQIVLTSPPAQDVVVTAGFEFDVPVRFDTDRIAVSASAFQAGDIPSVPVVELRQ